MANMLWIENLDYSVNNAELANIFAEFGTVVYAKVERDKQTQKSMGIGHVEMSSGAQTRAAAAGLHDRYIKGRRIRVIETRSEDDRPGIFTSEKYETLPLLQTPSPADKVDLEVHRVELEVQLTKEPTSLPFEIITPVRAIISLGSANSADLAELFSELSYLYRLMGGSGISFYYENSKELVEVEA